MWILRDVQPFLEQNKDVIQVIRGPRQCGKSSLLLHLDSDFIELSLDDPALRELAQTDPTLFLSQFEGKKILIDEAQYAPELFPVLKRKADLYKRTTSTPQTLIRLTGSNQILMDRNVKETLAGRASFFDLNTLSVAEILRGRNINIQEILYQGGWPELYAYPDKNAKKYLDDYISSFIEKDIVLSAGIQKRSEFLKCIRLLAGRVGELLNLNDLAVSVGVDSKTIKDWISVLEKMQIVALVYPYSTNLSKKLIKTPKLYFLDTGLACRLQGWTAAVPIMTSPQQGHLFENLVFSELVKFKQNHLVDLDIFFWRSRDGEEVDFLLQLGPEKFFFLEAKVTAQKLPNLNSHREVKKVFKEQIPEVFLCHQEGDFILDRKIPLSMLSDFLLKIA
jgi:uncharacterized protein